MTFDVTNYDHALEAALHEIRTALQESPREPGWVTVGEYAVSEDVSIDQARRDLEKGAATGKLTKDKRKIGRRIHAVYRAKADVRSFLRVDGTGTPGEL